MISNDITCQFPACQKVRHSRGPFCRKHGCHRCGLRMLAETKHMPEPACFECFEKAKALPRMKMPPQGGEKIYHEAIEVDADKFSNSHLKRKVLPGLTRSDGKPMSLKLFKRMCGDARAKGFVVLPPCETINKSGQCLGHDAPKISLEVVAADPTVH